MAKRIVSCCLILLVFGTLANADVFGTDDNQFDIEFVTIRHPGNPADTTGSPNPVGAVDYVYRMGKYEVSRDMVNKANADGGLEISLHDVLGIPAPRPDLPATVSSWNYAARFVNWLNVSKGISPAYKFATQPGDVGYKPYENNILLWEPGEDGYDANNLFRNSQSLYFLPSVHEWYKSAYYDPNANDGSGGYWNYPTGSDSVPTPVTNGTDEHSAVWNQSLAQGPAEITRAGGLSPLGTMAQGGNVWEWEETEFDLDNNIGLSLRGVRGGSWGRNSLAMSASLRDSSFVYPSSELQFTGFRVASRPMADINTDRSVDAADAGLMFANWGQPGVGDLNMDDIVDAADAGILAADWTGDGTASVPESSSSLLLLLASSAAPIALRRRTHI